MGNLVERLAMVESRLSERLLRRTTHSVVATSEGELYCEMLKAFFQLRLRDAAWLT